MVWLYNLSHPGLSASPTRICRNIVRIASFEILLELTDEVDECQNQIRVQAKKVRSKLKRFKKENDARIEADSEIAGSFLDRCARKSLKI